MTDGAYGPQIRQGPILARLVAENLNALKGVFTIRDSFMFALEFAGRPQPSASSTESAASTPSEDDQETGVEQGDSLGDEANAVLLSLLPWGVSVLFHVGVVLLAIFVVWSTIDPLNQEEEVIIPIARLSVTPGAPLTMKTIKKKIKSKQRVMTKSVRETPTNLSNQVDAKIPLIGAAGGSPGKASPFGSTLRTQSGARATMYGSGGNAKRLAYIIDASGSLLDSMPFVINEIKRSISELSDQQSFTVIFFQGDTVIEVPPRGLKKATSDLKKQVIHWVDMGSGNIIPHGSSNPVKAVKLALRYKPQLVFLLSDNITGRGQYEMNQKRLIDEIKKANAAHTKINTIQFLYPDPLVNVGLKPTLELISKSTGGIYKFVDGRELGIQW